MSELINYSGFAPDLHRNILLVGKIEEAIQNSPISADVEYGIVYDDEEDEWEGRSPYRGIIYKPTQEEMAIFYDDLASVDVSVDPEWEKLVNQVLDIMDDYSAERGWEPAREDEQE